MNSEDDLFLNALRKYGVNISEEECTRLKSVAVAQHKKEKAMAVFKQDAWNHYVCLLMSWLEANYEMMFWVHTNSTKFKLKQDFNNLKSSIRRTLDGFIKANENNKVLLDAYRAYADDLIEMLCIHLDDINLKVENDSVSKQ